MLGGAGAIAVEVNLTIVIESQCATQATLDERAGVGGDKVASNLPNKTHFRPNQPAKCVVQGGIRQPVS